MSEPPLPPPKPGDVRIGTDGAHFRWTGTDYVELRWDESHNRWVLATSPTGGPPPPPPKPDDVRIGIDGSSHWRWTGTEYVALRWDESHNQWVLATSPTGEPPPPAPKQGELRIVRDGSSAWRWTGTQWVQLRWTNRCGLVFLVIGIVMGIMIAAIYVQSQPHNANAQGGITKLTRTVQDKITFDYTSDKTCSVKCHYIFLDAKGSVVGETDSPESRDVTAHVTCRSVDLNRNVPRDTSRIDITPNCQ